MKIFIFLTLLATVVLAAPRSKPPPLSSPWVLYKWNSQGQYVNSGDGVNWSFPLSGRNVAYPAFVTTTTITNLIGNLTGSVLAATVTVTATGSPNFVWGGLLSGWNTGGLPANTRFFISTSSAAYSNPGYTACPTCYWFCAATWAQIGPGTFSILNDFDPNDWSDAMGHSGADPAYNQQFLNAVSNVRQIGLCFGGGSFYDVGVAVLSGSGTASFTLNDFSVQ